MPRLLPAALWLALVGVAAGQSVTLPAEIKASPGAWFVVAPEAIDGGTPKWRFDPGLQEVRLDLLFPPEIAEKAKGKVFTATTGRYKIEAWNAKGDVASDIAVCWAVIGDAPPAPGPSPQPGPQPTPQPLAGLRVLVIYETGEPLPREYNNALASPDVRQYLNAKCLKGPDGKTPEQRFFDDDSSLANLPAPWPAMRAALPTQLTAGPAGFPVPHVAIGDAAGSVVFAGEYPGTESEAVAFFKRFGGP